MKKLKPALFILFGTTGDLARKKLIPALYTLFSGGWIHPDTRVLGVGRRDWSDAYYLEVVMTSVRAAQPVTASEISDFLEIFTYCRLDIAKEEDYAHLWQMAECIESALENSGNRIYFLSTAPDLFPVIAQAIGKDQPVKKGSFRRLMIEKPFGHDLDSARDFNDHLRRHFEENEIFRIDHYLGKEMLQNILVLRFANRLFEPAWHRDSIDHIQITVSEKIGIDQRGGYYDRSGALRDMVQNHMLQLLALLTMNRPESFDSEGIRDAKVDILRRIRLFDEQDMKENIVLGQYVQGSDGEHAYKDEKGVESGSKTETFAALRLFIDHERWQHVPIYIRTGKRMQSKQAKITVVYKKQSYEPAGGETDANMLIIRVQPREGVDLRYSIKKPGTVLDIIPVEMDYCQTCQFPGQSTEAYVKLLLDAWKGDLNLFTRWDEIEATWTFIDSIRQKKESIDLYEYPAGQDGPKASDKMIQKSNHEWLDL